jgi:peptidyl-prolyl isomerase H (cyclophilin H)
MVRVVCVCATEQRVIFLFQIQISQKSGLFVYVIGCQFFITTGQADFLDGKHCVFGEVLDAASMLTVRNFACSSVYTMLFTDQELPTPQVRKIENVPVSGHTPKLKIEIVECGEL